MWIRKRSSWSTISIINLTRNERTTFCRIQIIKHLWPTTNDCKSWLCSIIYNINLCLKVWSCVFEMCTTISWLTYCKNMRYAIWLCLRCTFYASYQWCVSSYHIYKLSYRPRTRTSYVYYILVIIRCITCKAHLDSTAVYWSTKSNLRFFKNIWILGEKNVTHRRSRIHLRWYCGRCWTLNDNVTWTIWLLSYW